MLALSLLAAATAMSPKPGELKSFGDWAVGCDNVRHCTAVSLMEMESGENQLTVTIVRSGGRSDVAKLSIANIENRKPGEFSLVVDGTATLGTAEIKNEEDPFSIELTSDGIAKLMAGRAVELRDVSGASLGGASLKGVIAALLYMDDLQGRAKGETALIAKGAATSSSLANPPAIPIVQNRVWPKGGTLPLSAKDIATLQARTGCDADDRQIASHDAYRLDNRTWLALVPCGAGAYNFTVVPVLVNRGSISRKMKIAEFDFSPGFTEAGGPPVLVNANWDAATGQLSSYAKGRGLSDCGNAETYVWDGRRFRLISKIAMEECRGVIDWIPVWQAKAVRR